MVETSCERGLHLMDGVQEEGYECSVGGWWFSDGGVY